MNQQEKSTETEALEHDASLRSQTPCVLLVEDDRSVRRYLEVTLQRSGYRVITASDGLEAMKLALASEIDVVITDAVMPHLSGQQLAKFLRANPRVAHLPVILLTGQANRAVAATGDDQIDAFLYKPVNAGELTNCLARLLQKSHPINPNTGRRTIPHRIK